MDFKSIIYNEFGRLRSGLRFTIFLLTFFILAIFLGLSAITLLSSLSIGFTQNSIAGMVVNFGSYTFAAIFLGWVFGKLFEDVPFRALGVWFTKNWFKDLSLGLFFGVFSILLAALIAYIFGGTRFESNQTSGRSAIYITLGATFLIFTVGAIAEEVLFRGYMLQTFSRSKLFNVGLILTSFLFASAHNQNPGANYMTWLNTFLAGIWLAVAYYKTRNLWFPFGVHFAWNWVQGAFLGINVSGLSELASAPILRVSEVGDNFVSGGDYGLEGGISCTVALIIATAAIYFSPFLNPTEEMLALTSEEKPLSAQIS